MLKQFAFKMQLNIYLKHKQNNTTTTTTTTTTPPPQQQQQQHNNKTKTNFKSIPVNVNIYIFDKLFTIPSDHY